MIYFVGAGSGAADLITVRGANLLAQADVVVWAGSLVNPELLSGLKKDCTVYDSAKMTLEETNSVLVKADSEGKMCVRLHTGDPCLYGAIREQMEELDKTGAVYEVVPGVSSFCGAASSLKAEYTVPGGSQTLIISRMEGKTPVPEKEKIRNLASHGSSMVLFLSAGMIAELASELKAGGVYTDKTPAAVVYKATWKDEKIVRGTLGDIARKAKESGITKTALVLVGGFLGSAYEKSRLYDKTFTTEYRKAIGDNAAVQNSSLTQEAALPFTAVRIVCFTLQGKNLAQKIAADIPLSCAVTHGISVESSVCDCFGEHKKELSSWCRESFEMETDSAVQNRASHVLVVFVGAAGIAVRTIAPYLKDKSHDPAVVSIDDAAHFVIPIASGHLGSANDASRVIAGITGAVPAITTSTDVNSVWAPDSWAVKHSMTVANPAQIKKVSSSLLAGNAVVLKSDIALSEKIKSELPEQVVVSYKKNTAADGIHEPLVLVPRIVVIGVGCRRGVSAKDMFSFVSQTLDDEEIDIRSVCAVASIDIKKDEDAIIALSKKLNVPFVTFSAEELNAIDGEFSLSSFVKKITGTDTVCERAAVCACSGKNASCLILKKRTGNGMTLAAAVKELA